MESCIELGMKSALKSSFLSNSSTFQLDDFFSFNAAASTVVAAAADVDFSSVDSFLDLSDDEKGPFVRQEPEEEELQISNSNSEDKPENFHFSTSFAGVSVQFPLPKAEDFDEDLEWLSNFVDNDSDSKLTRILYSPIIMNNNNNRRTTSPSILLCLSSPLIPAKSRSKRTRTLHGKLWGSTASAATTTTTSSSSSSTSCCSSIISYGSSNPSISSNNKKKILMKRSWSESESTQQMSRSCSHCHVQKTPQWRSGPLGAKTLCNACGVRYKSGRLFPEYRPACSPTFTGHLHSNSHRKVLEMRRNKD